MSKTENPISIGKLLAELDEILAWFENQEDVNVEEGLTKAKKGAELIKTLKSRLKVAENEFEELKKDLDEE